MSVNSNWIIIKDEHQSVKRLMSKRIKLFNFIKRLWKNKIVEPSTCSRCFL